MKIKTNLRAGKGGATGTGQNGNGGTDNTTVETSDKTAGTVTYYAPTVSRCPGY